ncbi:MAG: hypothetical protein JNN32_04820, partial [Flavobacteriales bacterium]|nr:hypothetical protein [Flavobacteriales bacterium]
MLTTLRERAIGLAFGATALLTLSTASAQMNIALVPTADPEVFEFHWTANAAYSGIMNSVFSIRWDASAGGDISEDDFVNLCSNTRAPLLTNDLPVEVVGGFRYFTFRCDGSSSLGTTAQCGFAVGQTRALHRFRIAGISGCPNIGLSNDAYLDGLNRDYFVSVGGVPATGTFLSGQIGAPFTVTPGSYGPVCSNAADIVLGGSPAGGTWSGTGVTGNNFDPSVGTQTLTYTVTQSGCTVSQTTTITVSNPPTAGTNGTLTICAGSTVTAAQLFAQLGGSPQAGGTWSPTPSGAGLYTYTVAAIAPCTGNATATVNVTAQPAPNAGTNGTLTICAGSTVTAAQLFAQLGGSPQAGGTWSPTPSGAGLYTYTVAAIAPCTGNATA